MSPDWSSLTAWSSLAGGLLIGCAASLLMLGSGRVAGITTLVAGPLQALTRGRGLRSQRASLLFMTGLLAAPMLWLAFGPLPAARGVASPLSLVLAGLLVGFGTRMANGCTSGHGVCGLSRGSRRSLVNVLVFIGAGIATVAVLRALGWVS